MERIMTRTLFIELSLSLFGFVLLVSLFFHPKSPGKYATPLGNGMEVAVEVSQ